METFSPKVKGLLMEKNHGVLVTGIALMREMVTRDEGIRNEMRKFVPHLVRIFSSLLQYGFSPEYDVGGVTDPFLQVKILRLMRVLGEGNAEASDAMNVVLAGVATNTDNVRNVGNSILYECVNTIMGIDSEAGLRVLAINTLAKFLAHRDNNIRYVALNTLCTVVNIDMDAVQRHRNTIVDCLKDIDISIRRRALELVYSLVNASNVRVLVRELINFLQIADIEFRPDLTAKLCIVAEKYAPTPRWQIDTILRVMTISGEYVPEATCNALMALIAQNSEIQSYAVQKMYIALAADPASSQSLVKTAVWTIGEYGEYLLGKSSSTSNGNLLGGSASSDLLSDLIPNVGGPVASVSAAPVVHDDSEDGSSGLSVSLQIGDDDLVTLFKTIMTSIETHMTTKHQVLTAALKLTTRMPSASHPLHALISQYESHINVELQQRATEYDKILDTPQLPGKLLMKIPAPEVKSMLAASQSDVSAKSTARSSSRTATPHITTTPAAVAAPTTPNLLDMDLLDLNGGASSSASSSTAQSLPSSTSSPFAVPLGATSVGSAAPVDLLSFLGSTSSPSPAAHTPNYSTPIPVGMPTMGGGGAMGGIAPSPSPSFDLLTPTTSVTTPPPASASPSAQTARIVALKTADGLQLVLDFSKPVPASPQFTLVQASFTNTGAGQITDLDLKLSLPKYLKLQFMPISATTLAPFSGAAQQQVKLANTAQGQKPIMMIMRVEYKLNGEQKAEIAEPEIPSSL